MVDGPRQPNATMVARALQILETLDNSRRGLNISEISRKLGIPKSSTHVIMLTLQRMHYVYRPAGSRHFSLGLKAYGLGQKMIKSLSMAEMALPHMEKLAQTVGLTTHLAVPDKDQALCIQKVEAPGLIRFDTNVGRHMELHCTALGKVILAFGGDDLLKDFLSKKAFMRHTRNTITSARALRSEAQKVRRQGFAIDDQEEELDVRCIAVPIFNRYREFAGALSATGTTGQLPLQSVPRLFKALQATARSIYGSTSSSSSDRAVK